MIKTNEEIFRKVSFEIETINSRLANSKIVGVLQIDSFPIFSVNSSQELEGVNVIHNYLKEINKDSLQKYKFYEIKEQHNPIQLHQVIPSGLKYVFNISYNSVLNPILGYKHDDNIPSYQAYVSILDFLQYDCTEKQKVSYLILGIEKMGYLIILYDNLDNYFFDETKISSSNNNIVTFSREDCYKMLLLLKNPSIPISYEDLTKLCNKKDNKIAIEYIKGIIAEYNNNGYNITQYKTLEKIMDNNKDLNKIFNLMLSDKN